MLMRDRMECMRFTFGDEAFDQCRADLSAAYYDDFHDFISLLSVRDEFFQGFPFVYVNVGSFSDFVLPTMVGIVDFFIITHSDGNCKDLCKKDTEKVLNSAVFSAFFRLFRKTP